MGSVRKCQPENCPAVLDNVAKEFVDGVMYQLLHVPISIQEMLNRVKAVKILDDDIIIVGIPRSGNHWALEVIHMARHQTTDYHPESLERHFLNFRVALDQMDEESFPPPRILTTHVSLDKIPAQVVDKETKVIFLQRNPKDAMVSFYHLSTMLKSEKDKFMGTWAEYFETSMDGFVPYGNWFDHTLASEKYMEENPQVPVHVHVYEEVKLNPVGSIKKLCQFLEVPTSLAEKIAQATSFKDMKASTDFKFQDAEELLFQGKERPSLMRKGTIGDWKNYFTVAQSERFDKIYKERMAQSKLAKLTEKYMEV